MLPLRKENRKRNFFKEIKLLFVEACDRLSAFKTIPRNITCNNKPLVSVCILNDLRDLITTRENETVWCRVATLTVTANQTVPTWLEGRVKACSAWNTLQELCVWFTYFLGDSKCHSPQACVITHIFKMLTVGVFLHWRHCLTGYHVSLLLHTVLAPPLGL